MTQVLPGFTGTTMLSWSLGDPFDDTNYVPNGVTLIAPAQPGDTSIQVSSSTGFAANTLIQVDEEFMFITSTATGILNVQRGLLNSGAVSHASGAAVEVSIVMYLVNVNGVLWVMDAAARNVAKMVARLAGGTIDNTPIGTSTPRAGIFTVLEATGNLSFFGVPLAGQQTGGAATAGATYTANEQNMLQAVYSALRAYGLLS